MGRRACQIYTLIPRNPYSISRKFHRKMYLEKLQNVEQLDNGLKKMKIPKTYFEINCIYWYN